jgi:hypothetical protein
MPVLIFLDDDITVVVEDHDLGDLQIGVIKVRQIFLGGGFCLVNGQSGEVGIIV